MTSLESVDNTGLVHGLHFNSLTPWTNKFAEPVTIREFVKHKEFLFIIP